MRRSLLAAALAIALVLPASALAYTPWNLNGPYYILFTCTSGCAATYNHSVLILSTDGTTGAVTGTGYWVDDTTYTWTITGTVTGSDVTLDVTWTAPPEMAIYNPLVMTGTIDQAGAMSGTAIDAQGRTFDWQTTSGSGSLFPNTYHSLTPARLLDTRVGTGLSGVFTSGTPRSLAVTGHAGVPAGAIAVTGNLTVTNQTSPGFVALTTVSTPNPATSTLNFPLGDNRANGVTAPLGAGGVLWATYRGEAGGATTDLLFDVTGYFLPDATGATYVSLTPARLLDTRVGTGLSGVFTSGTPRSLAVTGHAGVPAGAIAVTGNLTVTNQTSPGFVALTTVSTPNPATSTLNFPLGDNRANGVTAPLGAGGVLWATYRGEAGGATTDLLFDVTGYFLPDATGATYVSLTPARLLDTRVGTGLSGVFTSGTPRSLAVTGHAGVPAGAIAVTGNLTVTNQTSPGFVALTTVSTPNPATSTLNFPLGDNRANGVTAPLGAGGVLWATYRGEAGGATTDLLFDVTGYFAPAPHFILTKVGVLDKTVVAPSDLTNPGDKINYTLTLTNDGNQTLTGVTIVDAKLGTLACTQPATVAPGAALVCTGSYTLVLADINAGTVHNVATGDTDQTPPRDTPNDVTVPQ